MSSCNPHVHSTAGVVRYPDFTVIGAPGTLHNFSIQCEGLPGVCWLDGVRFYGGLNALFLLFRDLLPIQSIILSSLLIYSYLPSLPATPPRELAVLPCAAARAMGSDGVCARCAADTYRCVQVRV